MALWTSLDKSSASQAEDHGFKSRWGYVPFRDPEQRREYQRKWVAQRRAEWFADKVCVDCGSADRLELDHVNPKIKVTHRVFSWSQERRERELAKCVARCATCHLIKSGGEKAMGQFNGNATMPDEKVADIKAMLASGLCQSEVARLTGVGRSVVWKIAHGKRRL